MRQLEMEEPNGEVGGEIGTSVTRGPCPTPHRPRGGSPQCCAHSSTSSWAGPSIPQGSTPPPPPAWLEPTLMEARSHRSIDI